MRWYAIMLVIVMLTLAMTMGTVAVIVDAHQGVPLRNAYAPFSVETSVRDK